MSHQIPGQTRKRPKLPFEYNRSISFGIDEFHDLNSNTALCVFSIPVLTISVYSRSVARKNGHYRRRVWSFNCWEPPGRLYTRLFAGLDGFLTIDTAECQSLDERSLFQSLRIARLRLNEHYLVLQHVWLNWYKSTKFSNHRMELNWIRKNHRQVASFECFDKARD